MKFFYIMPLWALAALGISINSAYYYDSFLTAGYPWLFAGGLSASFMGVESIIWLYPFKALYVPVLKVSIILFSISATLGSQFFSTSKLDSEIEKTVFVAADASGNVKYYREQVEILNKRIDEYISQQLVFGTDRNKEALEQARIEKAGYEEKLNFTQDKKDDDIQKINKPVSVYYFYAYRVPEILKGEIEEDFIRVMFQLFSSVIMALIAPICFSMIKSIKIKPKTEKSSPGRKKQQKQPLTGHDRSRITKALLYFYPESVIEPEKAIKYFHTLKKANNDLREYTLSECRKIHTEIMKHSGKDKEIIIKEVLR